MVVGQQAACTGRIKHRQLHGHIHTHTQKHNCVLCRVFVLIAARVAASSQFGWSIRNMYRQFFYPLLVLPHIYTTNRLEGANRVGLSVYNL